MIAENVPAAKFLLRINASTDDISSSIPNHFFPTENIDLKKIKYLDLNREVKVT